MGLVYVEATVSRPDGRGRARPLRLPRLRPTDRADFTLADGSVISRDVSECRFALHGKVATSPVVLGEGDEGPLLGAVTLETLGLMLNPLTREIRPMRLLLAACS